MNFSNIAYFLVTEKERNFTKAANKLHITQQTLSAQIAALERELDCTLFIRKSPLELTYGGEVFKKYAIRFEKDYGNMRKELEDLKQERRGILRIGIGFTRGRVLLPNIMEAFHKQYPLVETYILEESNDNIIALLLNGEIDIACAYFPEAIPGIQTADFYEEEILLLVDKKLYQEKANKKQDDGTILSQFASIPFLVTHPDDIAGRIGEKILRDASFTPQIGSKSKNMELLLHLCLKGEGACFCSESLFKSVLSPREQEQLLSFRFGREARFHISFGRLSSTYYGKINDSFIQIAKRENVLS